MGRLHFSTGMSPRRPRSIHRLGRTLALSIAILGLFAVAPASGIDLTHHQKAERAIHRGIEYLRSTQNDDGSWTPGPGPAVTGLVLRVMLSQPTIDPNDPDVQQALDYVLAHVREDGGIHDGILANYNTAISLSGLALINNRPEIAEAIAKGQKFLQQLQWKEQLDPKGRRVDSSHPFHGGAGYGNSGRPDISNTQFLLQALRDTGMDCRDPTFQRAIRFITRCQAVPQNDMFADQLSDDGGFIYSTSISSEHIGVPESKASPEMIDEGKAGRPVSGLRSYGSVTYAGFKSYVYALLPRDDPRVVAAVDWIRSNWVLDRNPGMPVDEQTLTHKQGLYYYYMAMGRALNAWGATTLELKDGRSVDWANELIDQVVSLQRTDGSWVNEHPRWMEDDPNLVTAYALIALINARD